MPWSYKVWYENNKVSVNRRRRLRYHADKKHRDNLITKSKERYRKVMKRRGYRDRRFMRGEDGERYASIGAVADQINRSVHTVRQYHSSGVIPEPTHTDNRGWRLYTRRQVRLLIDTFRRFDDKELAGLAAVAEVLKGEWESDDRQRHTGT